jgi:hypothetical protein
VHLARRGGVAAVSALPLLAFQGTRAREVKVPQQAHHHTHHSLRQQHAHAPPAAHRLRQSAALAAAMQQQLRAAAPQQLAVARCRVRAQRHAQPCRAGLVPAYKGAAVRVKKGELLKVVNTHGQQARQARAHGQLARALLRRARAPRKP